MKERRCANCGKPLGKSRNKTYCSRTCRNKHLTRKDMEEEPKYPRVCVVCGKEFLARRPNRKYCSEECNWKVQGIKKRKPVYKVPQGKLWNEARDHAYEKQDGNCWLCGKPLDGLYDLHHLKYGDHDPQSKELVALCKSCHNKIHHITANIEADGSLSFHGEAINLLKEKGYGYN